MKIQIKYPRAIHKQSRYTRTFIVGVILALTLGFLSFHAASAVPPNPMTTDDFPAWIKGSINDYDGRCPGLVEKYQILSWGSSGKDYAESDPDTTKIDTDPGQQVVPLKLNNAVFLCNDIVNETSSRPVPGLPNDGNPTSAAALRDNYAYITDAHIESGGGELSPNPQGSNIHIGYHADTRYWMGGAGISFNWNAGSPITSPRTITIKGHRQSANHFASGVYGCNSNGAQFTPPAGFPDNFPSTSQCPANEFTFTFRVSPKITEYNNQATLTKCAGQSDTVQAGDTICVVPGMRNNGNSAVSPAYVELDSYLQDGNPDGSPFLLPVSTNAAGDPFGSAGPWDGGQMANGQREGHYWWGRSQSPAYGNTAWSVQYQNIRMQIKPTTPVGTTICFQTLVSRATPSIAYSTSNSNPPVCFGVGVPPVQTQGCSPSLPNPLVDVSLPDVSPNTPAEPWLYFTYTRGDTYYQDVRQNNGAGKTQVVSVNDESPGGVRTPPTLVSQAYQTAKINYSPYVTSYPFDTNKPSVTYDSYYDRTTWQASSNPDGYDCSNLGAGWDLENNTGPNCVSWSASSGPYYRCPQGGTPQATGYGWLCGRPYSYGAYYGQNDVYVCYYPLNGPYATGYGWLCKDQYGNWAGGASLVSQGYYYCNSGDYLSGSTCYGTQWLGAAESYYTCPAGWTLTPTGYGWLCKRTAPAQPRYFWHKMGTVTGQTVRNTQYNTLTMNPCYNRTYDAYPTAGSATLTPDPENPNQSSFTGQVNVNFGTAVAGGQDPMRVASQVNNLPYTISYYIKRASGATTGITDVNGSATIQATNTNRSSNGAASVGHAIPVSVPATLQVGDQVCWMLSTTSRAGYSQTTGVINNNGTILSGSGQRQTPESCSSRVANEPYMRVYGSDVLSGSGFGVGCSVNNNAGILGWNKGNGAGAGTQFAAQAASLITGFASATMRGTNPVAPKGLSFGNTVGSYGGNFGTGQCAKDYFANASNVQTGYTTTGSTVPLAAHQTVYVDGDAFVRGNIVYAGNGSWTNLSQIPSYYMVVKGNIYISEQVTQLDGIYIAQPASNGTGGKIYTCVDHNTRQVRTTSPDAFTRCQSKLTINGAFIANQVKFLRTIGSLRDSTVAETSASPTIAEVFNYSPELFLVNPGVLPQAARQYESATGLPPVL